MWCWSHKKPHHFDGAGVRAVLQCDSGSNSGIEDDNEAVYNIFNAHLQAILQHTVANFVFIFGPSQNSGSIYKG
jgi:hypothetical protein